MRERKFRLLINGKIVGCERHVIVGCPSRYEIQHSRVSGDSDAPWVGWNIRYNDKQDFTGFTDTDGVEIYEGDVVEVPSKRGGSLHGTVVWLEKGGAWVVHFCLIQTDDWYMPLCDAVPKGCRVVKEGE